MRPRRYEQRATGSRVLRRSEPRRPWWHGLTWDATLAYVVTGVASLALLWLLAQVAIWVAASVVALAFLSVGASLAWSWWRGSSR